MQAYKVESTVQTEGVLTLRNLPFPPGQKVEVLILVQQSDSEKADKYSLRNSQPYRYDDPFEPAVSEEDWEVYK